MLAVAQVTSIISEVRVEFVFAIMKIKDLEVRGSSRVVFLDKALWSTLSLFSQVYKWVPATQLPGGEFPIMAYTGRSPTERGTLFRLQVYERVGILLVEVYERVCERALKS